MHNEILHEAAPKRGTLRSFVAASVLSIPGWWYGLLLGGIVVARAGIRAYTSRDWLDFVRTFPEPTQAWESNSVLGPTMGWIVGADSRSTWLVLHMVLTVVVLATIFLLISRRIADPFMRRFVQFWVAMSATPTSLFGWVGMYDVYSALGWALIVLPGSTLAALAGGVLLGATNVEQSLLGLGALTITTFALRLSNVGSVVSVDWRRIAAGAVGVIGARVGVYFWLSHYGYDGSSDRGEMFTQHLELSLHNLVEAGGLAVYGWYGLAWIPIIGLLWLAREQLGAKGIVLLLAGLVAIPAAASAVTLDGTRVFANVVLPSLLVALGSVATLVPAQLRASLERLPWPALLLALLTPAVMTESEGTINTPWHLL